MYDKLQRSYSQCLDDFSAKAAGCFTHKNPEHLRGFCSRLICDYYNMHRGIMSESLFFKTIKQRIENWQVKATWLEEIKDRVILSVFTESQYEYEITYFWAEKNGINDADWICHVYKLAQESGDVDSFIFDFKAIVADFDRHFDLIVNWLSEYKELFGLKESSSTSPTHESRLP